MVRRSLIAAALSLACALLQGGCSLPRTDSAIEHELSSELLRRLNEDDAAGVEAMFCEASRARPELRGEIERGMAFFEGRVETDKRRSYLFGLVSFSDNDWRVLSASSQSIDHGRVLEYYVNPHITGIVTDAGKRYEMYIYYYETCVGHEDLEGVSEIYIWEVLRDGTKGEKCVIGQYLDPSRPPEPARRTRRGTTGTQPRTRASGRAPGAPGDALGRRASPLGRRPDVDFGLPMTLGPHDHRAADGIGTVFCWASKKGTADAMAGRT